MYHKTIGKDTSLHIIMDAENDIKYLLICIMCSVCVCFEIKIYEIETKRQKHLYWKLFHPLQAHLSSFCLCSHSLHTYSTSCHSLLALFYTSKYLNAFLIFSLLSQCSIVFVQITNYRFLKLDFWLKLRLSIESKRTIWNSSIISILSKYIWLHTEFAHTSK